MCLLRSRGIADAVRLISDCVEALHGVCLKVPVNLNMDICLPSWNHLPYIFDRKCASRSFRGILMTGRENIVFTPLVAIFAWIDKFKRTTWDQCYGCVEDRCSKWIWSANVMIEILNSWYRICEYKNELYFV